MAAGCNDIVGTVLGQCLFVWYIFDLFAG